MRLLVQAGSKMIHHFKHCLTVYSTTREVKIPSKFLAITYLVLVIMVWCAYIGSLELDLRKVYQKTCPVHGSVVAKVKGVVSTEDVPDSEFKVSDPRIYKRVWDTSDLIFPPYGGDGNEGSFIAVTNLLITSNQSKGICPEKSTAPFAQCKKDSDCKKGLTSPMTSGVMTGKCSLPTGTCEVNAWCPIEENILPLKGKKALLEGVQDFTIMIKNTVEFPDCGKDLHKRNILDSTSKEYLSQCNYNLETDKTCPIFRLGDIVLWSGHNFSDVARTGAVFRIEANWECDFDWGGSIKDCFPQYKFSRIDESDAKISPGWNFRSAYYYEEDRRTLMKLYGLKIVIETTGEGRRFDFFTLVVTIGATIGLFSLAPLACDFLFELLCVLKRFKLFAKCFRDFSVKARYQDSEDFAPPKVCPTKFELAASNNTIEESVTSH